MSSITGRIVHILRQYPPEMVLDEAARALEQADTHDFAVNREDVAWLGAALALSINVQPRPSGSVVHTIVAADAVETQSRLG